MHLMPQSIEALAENSWRARNGLPHSQDQWSAISLQFFGMSRLALWMGDKECSDLAECISDLARQRAWMVMQSQQAQEITALSNDVS